MSNVNVSSLLIETRKKLQSASEAGATQTASGIDFANDTVLVSSANEILNAQEIEYSMNAAANEDRLNVEHLNDDFMKAFSQYQAVLNMEQLARNSAEELSVVHSSVLQQLSAANQSVASLELQKNSAANEVSLARQLVSALRQEKSEKIMMHDDNIASYQNQVTSSKLSIGNYNNSINASNSNISNMQNQIGELSMLLEATFIPEEKALIQQKIDNLKAQIEKERANIFEMNKLISEQEKNISQLEGKISKEEKAKSKTETSYNQKIAEAEANLENKEKNYDMLNEKLAEAVYSQTGLTLQEAEMSFKVKEAQIYLQSVSDLLKILSTEMQNIEFQLVDAKEKLVVSQDDENDASERTMQLEAKYNTDVQIAIQKRQQNQGKNVFLG